MRRGEAGHWRCNGRWRALWLRYEAEVNGSAEPSEVFDPDELAVLQATVSQPLERVAQAARAVAKLGGRVGASKRDLPGTRVLAQGLEVLAERVAGSRPGRATRPARAANRCSCTR